ncbi:hypothetical protein KOI35_22870 [Actinoplanes bogorensis]|uniref:histidine kinase n=1 Tax=Paractinoplanes bogorensis TaxID=1610840 RepID=A0ABS5YSC8_9ACTN|nr:histidine kinase [Actinoplanes bogorensis]MBU2666350.1 hypothetical protein [Actinoplanes bogorensis]
MTSNTSRGAVVTAALFALLAVALCLTGPTGPITVLVSVTALVYVAVAQVGAVIIRSRPRRPIGWIFLVSGVAMPVSAAIQAASDLALHTGRVTTGAWLAVVQTPFAVLGAPLVATYGILLFPDRHLGSRGRRILARVYAFQLAGLLIWGTFSTNANDLPVPNPIAIPATDGGVLLILIMGPLSALACVSLWRYARADPGEHAPALRTASRVAWVVPAAYLACVVAGMTTGETAPVAVLENMAAVAVGVAAWVGIVRYGLFDTRAVLSRTLTYALLTVALAAVWLAVAVGLGLVFGGLVPQVVAAVTAALAVLPLRDLAQRRINQLVYGLRDDPAAAFARLGDRLDATAEPAEMLPAAARTVAEALRLPYVAIEVGGETLCRHGKQLPDRPVDALPLPFAGETVGRLQWQDPPGGRLRPDERRLLTGLTRQVAVAARAVVLTEALQNARQTLVAAREEERRRLRRDLHDGLGPTLAGIALGIDTARRSVPAGEGTAELLGTLREATEAAVGDIRRIVYDLRPPVLDELGLAGAVREQAVRLGAADIDVPADLPPLPAAVEVAAYRIAVEALTNAARHAPGTPVSVRLSLDSALEVSVSDDGAGLPDGYRAGVGLTSMRERAAELGGHCRISRREPRGTLVHALIPLPGVAG